MPDDETVVEDADHRRRRSLVTLCRLALSAAMLVFLFTQVPSFSWQDLFPTWSAATAGWLAAAALLTLAGIVLSAVRWQQVLAALGVRTKLSRLVRHSLAGHFVSNVLPTTIGGDVLRVARLSRETGESPRPFASVVLERLTGWLVLPALTMVGLLVNPGLRHLGVASRLALSVAVATLVLLAAVVVAGASSRIGGRFASREDWRRFVGAIHLGLSRLRQSPAAAANVLAAGFAYQLVLVLAAVAAAQALGLKPAGLTALLAFFPAVMIAQVLPISVAGLGVREAAFVVFLTPLGIANHEAIALGLLLYLLNMGVSLLGVPAFASGGRRPPSPDEPGRSDLGSHPDPTPTPVPALAAVRCSAVPVTDGTAPTTPSLTGKFAAASATGRRYRPGLLPLR